MKKVQGLLVVATVLLLSVIGCSGEAFSSYNCATSQYIIDAASQTAVTIWIQTSANNYASLVTMNAPAQVRNALPVYITAYSGQTYAIFNSNRTAIATQTTPTSTCPQTLSSYEDEFTRVFNLARTRVGRPIVYRNAQLDRAAFLAGSNSTTPNALAASGYPTGNFQVYFFNSAQNADFNPGALVQMYVNDGTNNQTTFPEFGVSWDAINRNFTIFMGLRTVRCGNGLVEAGENCDDGNNSTGDGCSNCQIDSGYSCSQNEFQPTSVCVQGVPTTTASAGALKSQPAPSTGASSSNSPSGAAGVSGSATPSISPAGVSASPSTTATVGTSSSSSPILSASGTSSSAPSGTVIGISNSPVGGTSTGGSSALFNWLAIFV